MNKNTRISVRLSEILINSFKKNIFIDFEFFLKLSSYVVNSKEKDKYLKIIINYKLQRQKLFTIFEKAINKQINSFFLTFAKFV